MMLPILNGKLFSICPLASLIRRLLGFHYCHRSYARFDLSERKGYEVDNGNPFVISWGEGVM